jgi:CRISPR-associated protein Cmr3
MARNDGRKGSGGGGKGGPPPWKQGKKAPGTVDAPKLRVEEPTPVPPAPTDAIQGAASVATVPTPAATPASRPVAEPGGVLCIRALEPLLFRDGRPLAAAGGAAISLVLPLPSTIAGCVRTGVGKRRGWDWSAGGREQALALTVAGPIGQVAGEPVFPAPADAVVHGEPGALSVMRLHPDLGSPCRGEMPGGLAPMLVTQDAKPARGYRFWRQADMHRWLLGAEPALPPARVPEPPMEERVHVALRDDTGTAEEGMLFTTRMVCLENHVSASDAPGVEWSLLARTDDEASADAVGILTAGGERRLASAEPAGGAAWPACPEALRSALAGAIRVRLALATPALFDGGWKPGWLDEEMVGSPPSAPGLTLKLVAAAVGRREPVSGWDLATQGPKAVRWMAPAGSVYFFEVLEGAGDWAPDAWLQPVSDGEQDRRDGFGLSLWGVW